MRTWQTFLLEQKQKEFSTVMAMFPSVAAAEIRKYGEDLIYDEDVYIADDKYGRENEPHITILFGIHADTSDQVKNCLDGEGSIKIKLGKTSIFESNDYDVVKIGVLSNDLHRLHDKLKNGCTNTQTFPNYHPHVTLSYVKKGCGKKYTGDNRMEGSIYEFDNVVFSNKNRVKSKITL